MHSAIGRALAAIVLPATCCLAGTSPDLDQRLQAAWMAQLRAKVSGPVPTRISPESDAAGGCDGVRNGAFGFHTGENDGPWWQVDLGAVQPIDRVEVYNRCTVSERAARVGVLLSPDGKAWQTLYRHNGKIFLGRTDGKPLVVPLGGAQGRFVRIQLPGRTWLHLDEIEVYGSGEPKKNIALHRPASQSSASQWSNGAPAPADKPGALPRDPYVAAVREALANGQLLAADLRARGVDTAAFERAAGEVAAALDGVESAGDELRTGGLYGRARRAVRELALSNPLLGSGRVLIVRRGAKNLGLPANWQSNSSLHPTGYDNDIAVLSDLPSGGRIETLYRPEGGRFVGDVDLNFDARRMLLSMPDERGQWRVYELDIDPAAGRAAGTPRKLPLIDQPDVGNYDACYLPNGNVIFSSTAPFIGVPCVRGDSHVTNLYLWTAATGDIRRLTFDQDHDWCPAVLNNGRVMYLRWEYSDLPHSNSRILFHMNGDGTGQMELYGSNSYWPNSVFYARPIPGHPSRVVGIVTGHHGVPRMGELVIFDPAKGRHEADGVVQRIPGRGQPVEPVIRDQLVNSSWPKFLHPYPLGESYIVAACKPTPASLWGIYLVDTFDNMVLLAEQDDYALLEPIPLRATSAPPVIADKVDPKRPDATVYLVDVYRGGGMEGIPRGTVKKLRLLSYHFSYHGVGGLLGVVGSDGPWDVKRIVGTVPVEPDGSAFFRVPANTPISVQPLDEHGQALQIMRSWFVGMPGENVSCVGCHERQDEVATVRQSAALRRAPSAIEPWRGPVRGFSYAREVQPVVDKYCLACHNPDSPARPAGPRPPDLRGVPIVGWQSQHSGHGGHDSGKFSVGYTELARYVRRPGIESNIHLLTPMEYHASTTELVQMLRKGHHNVRLDSEAWDRLITWIDLNAPYHGTWGEIVGTQRVRNQAARRAELLRLYAGISGDDDALPPAPPAGSVQPVLPAAEPQPPAAAPTCPGWPFDPAEAQRRQAAAGNPTRTIDLGDGVALELALIPAGEFVMGDADGCRDESPPARVRIDRPFWIGRCEVTNEQFARFDALHDSRVESKHGYQFGIHGYPVNGPRQPVVRVSWREASAFCDWLARRTGGAFTLPTEAQWEYACRAGASEAFSYGGPDSDFSKFANLGDAKLREFASNPYTTAEPMANPNPFDDWLPKDPRFNDGALVSADVGGYQPNAWGLFDMHGNVAEWTRTAYRPYPCDTSDGRDNLAAAGAKVVRGGSWYDRPKRCRSAFRLAYPPYQRVFNVGFRVACPAAGEVASAGKRGN